MAMVAANIASKHSWSSFPELNMRLLLLCTRGRENHSLLDVAEGQCIREVAGYQLPDTAPLGVSSIVHAATERLGAAWRSPRIRIDRQCNHVV